MRALASLVRAHDRMATRGEVPPFGYSQEKIGFLVSLNADGTPAGPPIDLSLVEGKKRVAVPMAVPQPVKRTSGIAPNFLWDKTAYVLGVTAAEGKRTGEEHAAFIARHRDLLADTGDEGLAALLKFLESWTSEALVRLGWPDEMKDQNVVFALESERLQKIRLHDRQAAHDLWSRLLAGADKSEAACLVTGEHGPITRLHRQSRVCGARRRRVPRSSPSTSMPSPLMATNREAMRPSLRRPPSPMRPRSSDFLKRAAVTVSRSATPPPSSGRMPAMPAMPGPPPKLRMFSQASSPSTRSRRPGKSPRCWKPSMTGCRSKISSWTCRKACASSCSRSHPTRRGFRRFYIEDDFGVIAERYAKHIQRMRIEPPPREAMPSMWRLLIETKTLKKSENIVPNLAGEWMRAILTGAPYPLTLLATLLMRLRADHDVNALRVAIIKSVLIRNFEDSFKQEVPVSLDPENTEPDYLLGRLFAIYEQIQTAALGRNVNATIKDKFYGAAASQPRKIFPTLDKGSRSHLSKLGKDSKGYQIVLERKIGEIMEAMSPGADPFPAHLPDRQQGLFALGYYHQRSDFFTKNDSKTEKPVFEEPAT